MDQKGQEDFFTQPKAAEMAHMLVFLVENGRANQRDWDYHSGYSPRHAQDLRDLMEQLRFILVTRKPAIEITLTKEGEELARSLVGVNLVYKRILGRFQASDKR
jgi:hypothetical protein